MVIIKLIFDDGYVSYLGYGTYLYEGSKYAVITDRVPEARLYKNLKSAKRAYDRLLSSCCNIPNRIKVLDFHTLKEVTQ